MSLLVRRYRGFRVLNVVGVGVLIVLMLGVYWAKTRAAGDSSAIDSIERQIRREQTMIRNLEAEVASLEAPDRIVRLSSDRLGMGAVTEKNEAEPNDLRRIAGIKDEPAAPAVIAPEPVLVDGVPAPAPPPGAMQ